MKKKPLSPLAKKRKFLKQIREKAARAMREELYNRYDAGIRAIIEEIKKTGEFTGLLSGSWLFGLEYASDISRHFTVSQHALSDAFAKLEGLDGVFPMTTVPGTLPDGTKINIWKPVVGLK